MIDDGDLDYAPDVLILPSRLKQFTKVDLCNRLKFLLTPSSDCPYNSSNQPVLLEQRIIRYN